MTATCATITAVHTPPNCSPPAPAAACLSREPMPRVTLSAGITPAIAEPNTVSREGEQHGRGRQAEVEPEREPAQVHLEKLQAPVAERDIGGDEARHRRNAAEHECLGEHLHDDPAATRADGAPHDELALARGGAREQQQGDVAADEHEQHHREDVDREENPEILARWRREEQLGVGRHLRLQMFVRGRLLERRTAADRRQLRLRGLEGRAGSEHAEDRHRGTRTRRLVQAVGAQRHPQVVRDGEREAFAHHPDHRRVIVSQLHGAAEHIGVAPEARSPHVVTDHGHGWRIGPLVGW